MYCRCLAFIACLPFLHVPLALFLFCLVCAGGSDGGDDRSGNQGSERNLFRKTGSNAGSNAE